MEMRFQLVGASVGIPKTRLGLDFGSGVYFGFRHTPSAYPTLYGLAEEPSVGQKVGALGFGYLRSGWFSVSNKANQQTLDITRLAGKNVDFNVSKRSESADLAFRVFTETGDVTKSIVKLNVSTSGLLLNDFESRGKLRRVPLKSGFKW